MFVKENPDRKKKKKIKFKITTIKLLLYQNYYYIKIIQDYYYKMIIASKLLQIYPLEN